MNPTPLSPNALAAKYQVPVSVVEQLIEEETASVMEQARVTTFVPIFVTRRVEERLQSEARATAAARREAA